MTRYLAPSNEPMTGSPAPSNEPTLQGAVTRHALFWLVTANGVGILLAALLLAPDLGRYLAPFTFGRLVPLHLDFQLYGWCCFPLIGLLFRTFRSDRDPRAAKTALWCWSATLVLGGLTWLSGQQSGKLFLEWAGLARILFPAAMALLWLVLLRDFLARRRQWQLGPRLLRLILLLALAAVPGTLYLASGPTVYPAVNPGSGGATGTSLLGSTLGIVVLFLTAPAILGIRRRSETYSVSRLALLLGAHGLVFALLDHGNAMHHDPVQIIALAGLFIWPPLLIRLYRCYAWPDGSRLWLIALACWSCLLVSDGWISFLPGVLEHWKFTNAMVGHAHLAMAGMVTSFLMVLLISLENGSRLARDLGRRGPALVWNAGCGIYVLAMLIAGTIEGFCAPWSTRAETTIHVLYWLRLGAGALMFSASFFWLLAALAPVRHRAWRSRPHIHVPFPRVVTHER